MLTRFWIVALVVYLAIGCTTGAADGGGGGGGENPCDDKGSCSECSTCATNGACAAAIDQCVNKNSACAAIDQCASICGTDVGCKEMCVNNNPNGVADYEAATRCLYCDECPKDCAGYRPCE